MVAGIVQDIGGSGAVKGVLVSHPFSLAENSYESGAIRFLKCETWLWPGLWTTAGPWSGL